MIVTLNTAKKRRKRDRHNKSAYMTVSLLTTKWKNNIRKNNNGDYYDVNNSNNYIQRYNDNNGNIDGAEDEQNVEF